MKTDPDTFPEQLQPAAIDVQQGAYRQGGSAASTNATPENDAAIGRRIDEAIERALGEKRVVGAVVQIARRGGLIYRRAAGYADREVGRPMTETTHFRLSSLSKPFTTVAAMRLVEQGLLKLDDTVEAWLPDFRPVTADGVAAKITLRQLLSHTAGLSYAFTEAEPGPYRRGEIPTGLDQDRLTLNEVVARIAQAPLAFPPGQSWSYGMGHDVAGAVIAAATGQSWPDALRSLVLEPLGLNSIGFTASDPEVLATPYADATEDRAPARMTAAHVLAFNGAPAVFSPERALNAGAFPSGGAGLVGAAPEVLTLLEVMRSGGGLLAPSTAAQLRRPSIGAEAASQGPGWGFALGGALLLDPVAASSPMPAGTLQWGGFYGHNWFIDPQDELTVLVLTNTAFEGMWGRFPQDVRDAVYGVIA